MTFSLDVEREPTHWCLTLSGDLDYSQCSLVRMHVHRLLMSEQRCTIADMSGLEFLDSSGLGVLLAMSREYASHGGQLVLVTNATVDKVLSLSRLDRAFAIASTKAEAVGILGPNAPMALGNGTGGSRAVWAQ